MLNWFLLKTGDIMNNERIWRVVHGDKIGSMNAMAEKEINI